MQFELVLPLFLILGLITGLLGGLLGIGGGVITVPLLYYIFLFTENYPEKMMQIAVSTSLAAAFVTSGISTYLHLKKRAVQFAILRWMAPPLIVGCILGAIAADQIQSRWLSFGFACIAALLGVYFFFPKLPNLRIASAPNRSLSFFGLVIGALSSMLGIGGGSVAFPILLGYQVPVKNASATSSASTLITTGIGTLSYIFVAWNTPHMRDTFGYIDVPAFVAISVGSMITSPIGVQLAQKLDVKTIKRIFGCSLVLIAISMFLLG